MFGRGSKSMGMDLGTVNTLLYAKNKGIVLREPSVVVQNQKSHEIVAIGSEAHRMIGRTPMSLVSIQPISRGVIADYETTAVMIQSFLKEAAIGSVGLKKQPVLLIGVPVDITPVEKHGILDAARQAGARDALTIEESLAAAIGANLPVGDPSGCMVIDIGGGTTEAAVISLNGIVTSASTKTAGQAMDHAIVQYLRNTHKLVIGSRTAEMIKIEIGAAQLLTQIEKNEKREITGRDLVTGLPKRIEITAAEIAESLKDSVAVIIETIKKVLEKTPPELSSDIITCGMVLTGGGALLKNLDKAISGAVQVPVSVAEHPLDCVALGIGRALDNLHQNVY